MSQKWSLPLSPFAPFASVPAQFENQRSRRQTAGNKGRVATSVSTTTTTTKDRRWCEIDEFAEFSAGHIGKQNLLFLLKEEEASR